MSIGKVVAMKAMENVGARATQNKSFKSIMDQKRASLANANGGSNALGATNEPHGTLKSMVNDVVKNHETASATMKAFMARTDYSPERLLAVQYKTGILFLREQMFCKTAELSANTFKNFTQMQI